METVTDAPTAGPWLTTEYAAATVPMLPKQIAAAMAAMTRLARAEVEFLISLHDLSCLLRACSHTLAVNVLSRAIGLLSALEALRIEPWRKLYTSGHIAMTLTTQAGVVAGKFGE